MVEEPLCFKPSNCCSGQSQEWSLEAQRPSIYKEQEWVRADGTDANAGNCSRFYSPCLDFKVKSKKEAGFMKGIVDTLSMKKTTTTTTQKYSINQVFTGRKYPLGITLKFNCGLSICRS